MGSDDRQLRLRATKRDAPELGRLVEWVLNIAEARYRAYMHGDPDPFGLPVPESIEQIAGPEHGPASLAGPSNSTDVRSEPQEGGTP